MVDDGPSELLSRRHRMFPVAWRDRRNGQEQECAIRHLFLFVGAEPETRVLEGCPVAVDAHGFVLTGAVLGELEEGFRPAPLETSVPGLFAVGDVRSGSVKRVGGAIGEGAAAVAQVHRDLATVGAVPVPAST